MMTASQARNELFYVGFATKLNFHNWCVTCLSLRDQNWSLSKSF